MAKYINPYTDFGFKKLFGTEANKDLLIDFLNELVAEEHKIKDLTFNNPENLGNLVEDRKAIFDIYCETQKGEKIIIEMQKAKINFFKDRTVFYASFPIREQAEKGNWNFELKPVYAIGILDFEFDKQTNREDYISKVSLKDQYCETFYDKLTYIFIEMPKFNKKAEELTTHFEKWLYFLKNLVNLDDIPSILKEPIFEKGFKIAKLANLDRDQYDKYERSLMQYWDMTSVIETAFEEGREEGFEEGREEGREEGFEEGIEQGIEKGREEERIKQIKIMNKKGLDNSIISEIVGLPIVEVEKILKEK